MRRGTWIGGTFLAFNLAFIPAGHAQIRDAGAFGETCPAPPLPPAASPSGARLKLPLAPVVALAPEAPTLPLARAPSRRVLSRPSGWPTNTPLVVAFAGDDPGSLAMARRLPAGTGLLVVPPARPETMARLRAACPGCIVGPGRMETAIALGVRAYPAVVRRTGTMVEIIEGEP